MNSFPLWNPLTALLISISQLHFGHLYGVPFPDGERSHISTAIDWGDVSGVVGLLFNLGDIDSTIFNILYTATHINTIYNECVYINNGALLITPSPNVISMDSPAAIHITNPSIPIIHLLSTASYTTREIHPLTREESLEHNEYITTL